MSETPNLWKQLGFSPRKLTKAVEVLLPIDCAPYWYFWCSSYKHQHVQTVKFDDVWPQLKTTAEHIMHLQKVTTQKWKESFNLVYSLCTAYPEPLYKELYEEIQRYLENHTELQYKEISSSADLLATYNKCWQQYHEGIHSLNDILKYVNTLYVDKQGCSDPDLSFCILVEDKLLKIYELGVSLWKKEVVGALGEKLSWFLLEELKNDRVGKSGSPVVFKGMIQSFIDVERSNNDPTKLYREVFEEKFLLDTGDYYRTQVGKEIQKEDCSQYMEKVLQWLNDELLRSNKYLHSISAEKVTAVCMKSMVIDQVDFLHSGFRNALRQEVKKDFQNMYRLLKSVEGGLDIPASEMQSYITEVGCNVMNNVNDNNPEVFVEAFLEIRQKYLKLIEECFQGDKKFVGALDKACATMLKCEGSKIFDGKAPEVLSNYCDHLLRKNSKSRDEASVDKALSQAITVLEYVEDKDIFQNLYGRKLANRLLLEKSESFSTEEAMISKLKLTYGQEFTRKFQDMFSDFTLSKEVHELFVAYTKATNANLGCHVEVAVLKTSAWPFSGKVDSFAVPQELEKCLITFEQFYHLRHGGRKLTWLHQLSTADMKLQYLNKPYVISVTSYQMAVLLQFQYEDRLTYGEIKENTKLKEDQLSKVIKSLTESNLLLAAASNKNAEDTNESDAAYALNMKYSNNKIRIKIPSAAKRDKKENSKKETQEVQVSIQELRKMRLEPAIVRIMKHHKTLKHNALIQEVITTQGKVFAPKISLIKKCIDHLIELDYIERSTNSPDVYNYIA